MGLATTGDHFKGSGQCPQQTVPGLLWNLGTLEELLCGNYGNQGAAGWGHPGHGCQNLIPEGLMMRDAGGLGARILGAH